MTRTRAFIATNSYGAPNEVLDTALGEGHTVVNKADMAPAFMGHTIWCVE